MREAALGVCNDGIGEGTVEVGVVLYQQQFFSFSTMSSALEGESIYNTVQYMLEFPSCTPEGLRSTVLPLIMHYMTCPLIIPIAVQ